MIANDLNDSYSEMYFERNTLEELYRSTIDTLETISSVLLILKFDIEGIRSARKFIFEWAAFSHIDSQFHSVSLEMVHFKDLQKYFSLSRPMQARVVQGTSVSFIFIYLAAKTRREKREAYTQNVFRLHSVEIWPLFSGNKNTTELSQIYRT